MKKVYGVYIFIFLVLCAVFLYEYSKPQPIDWKPDMSTKGRNPFGQKILIENLEDVFDTVKVATTDLFTNAMEWEEGIPEIYPLSGTERTKHSRVAKIKQLTVVDSMVSSLRFHAKEDTVSIEEYEAEDDESSEQYQDSSEENSSDEYSSEQEESDEDEERLVVRQEAKNSAYIFTNAEFSLDQTDFFSLFTYVAEGRTVFIATEKFSYELALNFQIQSEVDYLPNASRLNFDSLKNKKQEFSVNRYYRDLFPKEKYYVSKEISTSYFVLDSECPADTVITNELGRPVLIAYSCGKGKIYLCSTPLLFTNFEILHGNRDFLTAMLVLLPPGKVYWDDYYKKHHKKFTRSFGTYERGGGYKRGTYYDRSSRRIDNEDPDKRGSGEYEEESESGEDEDKDQSILSFIWSNASLTWAWYTLLITLALYMLSSARRRQKLIPVVEKLQNTTVEFVQMIARLYYLKKDHRDIALKKINYFQEYLRSKYYHKDLSLNDANIEALARRSNKKPEQIKRLFELIDEVQSQGSISAMKLHVLSQKINEFKSST